MSRGVVLEIGGVGFTANSDAHRTQPECIAASQSFHPKSYQGLVSPYSSQTRKHQPFVPVLIRKTSSRCGSNTKRTYEVSPLVSPWPLRHCNTMYTVQQFTFCRKLDIFATPSEKGHAQPPKTTRDASTQKLHQAAAMFNVTPRCYSMR